MAKRIKVKVCARERDRERDCVCIYVYVYMCVCVCERVRVSERLKERNKEDEWHLGKNGKKKKNGITKRKTPTNRTCSESHT